MLACSQVTTSHQQDGPSGRVGLTSSLAGPGLAEEAERPAQEMGWLGLPILPDAPLPPRTPSDCLPAPKGSPAPCSCGFAAPWASYLGGGSPRVPGWPAPATT